MAIQKVSGVNHNVSVTKNSSPNFKMGLPKELAMDSVNLSSTRQATTCGKEVAIIAVGACLSCGIATTPIA